MSVVKSFTIQKWLEQKKSLEKMYTQNLTCENPLYSEPPERGQTAGPPQASGDKRGFQTRAPAPPPPRPPAGFGEGRGGSP